MEGKKKDHFFFASESVGEGHPDKLCDQVSDAIVDACLTIDPRAYCGVETAVKAGMLVLLGEIRMNDRDQVNLEQIARHVCKDVGFDSEDKGLDYQTMQVIVNVPEQSGEIASAVHLDKAEEDLGAGDQGIMFGYATDESGENHYHPLTHYYTNKMAEVLAELRHSKEVAWLRPDCKTQITMEYKKEGRNIIPVRVHNILISTQHEEGVTKEEIEEVLKEKVINVVIPSKYLVDTEYFLNPSGSFVSGGPEADAGLTGRKIIVDTYGGWAPHGGGAFSGKDCSKVDRSGAYYARYVAKSLVAAGLAHRLLIQVSYAIGVAKPLSIHVDSYGTSKDGYNDDDLAKVVEENFDFRPFNVLKELDLRRPIFAKSATFGHFGRDNPDFTWEVVKELKL
jgi:S-adenosylmethionine synthetase